MTTKPKLPPKARFGPLLAAALLTAALAGFGPGEESTAPAARSEATPKSGPVTKSSGEKMDVASEQQTATEANGG